MRSALVYALGACALWGLAFVAPAAGGVGGIPLTLVRYSVFGLSSVVILRVLRFNPFRQLDRKGWLRVIGIGFAGNTLYYTSMSGAVAAIGSAPVALIFGALPIIMTVVGNLRRQVLGWGALAGPMACIAVGLAITTTSTLSQPAAGPVGNAPALGLLLSAVALACWTVYSTWNAEYLADHPGTNTVLWASLTGVGTLVTLPILVLVQALGAPSPGAFWGAYQPGVLAWGVVLGLGASWVATALWSRASTYFSSSALGMLIVTEVIFALIYTLLLETRLPAAHELGSVSFTLGGVAWGLIVGRAARRRRDAARHREA
ncbi:DMT family transporter [Tessaracoccus sp. OS52]|uniref:DMT family transporter n=1 Tax=Tessaracoccus sp. OS52 TaxID=2886691 RepID=UPI001D117081|nr:DMT family transporter [Tessaracoccus sp. OS52]MCC2593582.1 DMT family transporter [Tessaracoccus sp. OS52]